MALTAIQTPNEICSTRNPIAFRIEADVNWASLENYYCLCYIEYEPDYRSGTWVELMGYREYPAGDREMVFDIAAICDRKVLPDPPIGVKNSQLAELMNTRFRVTFAEYYDNNIQTAIPSVILHGVRAGFPLRIGQGLQVQRNQGSFLTHSPGSKTVSPEQSEWLYYIVRNTYTDLFLEVTVNYTDGTASSAIVDWSNDTYLANDVIKIEAGYKQLGLDQLPDPVESWSVKLWDATGSLVVSAEQEYIIDCHHTPLPRYFLFENSLGGWDSLRTTGKATTNQETKSGMVTRRLGPYALYYAHGESPFNTTNRDQVEQAIGFQSETEQIWLRDLLSTRRAYRIGGGVGPNLNGEGDWIPINVKRETITLFEDEEFLNPLSFSYTESNLQPGMDAGLQSTQT